MTGEVTGVYGRLGVRPLINANAWLTRLGGSLMPPEVIEAMREASAAFVDMHELQRAVSSRIAQLTRNEAALVCSGASAGLVLATLACMTGRDLRALGRLIQLGVGTLPKRDVIVHCGQRTPYDPAIVLAGGRLVQIGNVIQTFEWELQAAIGPATAAVLYLPGEIYSRGALPLERVLAIAHAAGVPVIVDAAAQLPPPENLWRFAEMGADLVLFSGGKALRGPQASGLIVGKPDMVAACEMHAAPHQRLGRPMKVGKEEMCGLLAAVELYLAQDHAARTAEIERITAAWVETLGALPGVCARRDFPSEAGQPLPRARLDLEPSLGLTSGDVRAALLAGEPPIDVAVSGERAVLLNAALLKPGEETIVTDRVAEALRRP
ncbi:MAG: aminotransferase class V-fold PLP-dependent enzyme [Candidatus Limnocylindria bacterium]